MDSLALRSGASVLDLGCGCGATVLELAKRVGPGGRVVGIDVSAVMLARARERAEGLDNVTLVAADAQEHAFGDRYDALFSRFGWMFFADPLRALHNLRDALVPGGRLAFVTWRGPAENAWLVLPGAIAMSHLPLEPPDPLGPGPFRYAESESIEALLEPWSELQIRAVDFPLVIAGGGTLDEAVDFMLSLGMVAQALAQAAPAQRKAVRDDVRAAFAPHETPQGVQFNGAAWLISATC